MLCLICPCDLEPVEIIDDNKHFAVGDVVRPIGAQSAGQICEIVTKVTYHVKDVEGNVRGYELNKIFPIEDKEDQKLFAAARCKLLQNEIERTRQSVTEQQVAAKQAAERAQQNMEDAQKQAQAAMQESTTFLATFGSALDPKDFYALYKTLLDKQ